jgi:thiol:disulfide interchange protein
MKQAMKPVAVMFLALLAVVGASLVMKATRPDEIIPWRASYAAALDEARSANKPAFVYFTASWCVPCQSMKSTTWADRGVDAALRDYVPVKVDVDEHPDLAQKYNVTAMPTFLVTDKAGKVLSTWSGAASPEEFIRQLRQAGT